MLIVRAIVYGERDPLKLVRQHSKNYKKALDSFRATNLLAMTPPLRTSLTFAT